MYHILAVLCFLLVFRKVLYDIMIKIKDFINILHEHEKVLPLMHNMPETSFISMMEQDKEIHKSHCNVLNEDLTYYFYGKPSYIINTHNDGDCGDFYAPVCLILNPEKIEMYRVFPFDSGGYIHDKIDANKYSPFGLDEFELDNTISSITSYIYTFFGNNELYYKGKAKKDLKVMPNEKIIKCLLNIVESVRDDERSRTIEVSSKDNCDLKEAIIGIILPDELMVVDEIRNLLVDEWQIPYLTYTCFRSMTIKEYTACLLQIAYKFLKSNGYFI